MMLHFTVSTQALLYVVCFICDQPSLGLSINPSVTRHPYILGFLHWQAQDFCNITCLGLTILSDVTRRSEPFSSWTRQSRLWMQLLSTRMRPSLRDRGSSGLLPACSPSGRWIWWPNSATCLPLRPELCCASTSTRYPQPEIQFYLLSFLPMCMFKHVNVNVFCRWCLCVRKSVSYNLPSPSWKCN